MRILHVLSQNHLTGAEVYAVQLISEQIKNNHVVFQASNDFFTDTKAQKFQMPVETKGFFSFLKSIKTLRKFLIENKIQVIHSHSRAASKISNWARLGLKIGYVSSVHGRQHVSVSKKIHNIYGDFLIPVCENIQHQLQTDFKYNSRRIKIIANGIDQSLFFYSDSKNQKNKILNIGIIGRDSGPKKIRTEIFISEFSKILDLKKINYVFNVVGGNPANFKIQNPDVIFTESAKIDSSFYHKFDLICGSGRVCIESMISGVPVIAFGESQYCGLITETNYSEHKKSNFGDIGFNFNLPTFNFDIATADINQFSKTNLKEISFLASNDFNLSSVNQKIERLYQSNYFLRHYSKWIPILMYHKIPDQDLKSQHKIFVTKNNFEKHLQFFKNSGFKTLTFSDLALFKNGTTDFVLFPKKPLILTFDDGYQDNLTNADPLLKKYEFKAQIFLLADSKIQSNSWDHWSEELKTEKHLIVSEDHRRSWVTSNFTIGSHGLKHQKMSPMSSSEKIFELTESKVNLQSEFNSVINVFAYTYGDTNLDCATACEKTGYDYGVNTDTGGLLLEEDPYSVFRVNIFPDENFLSLWKKTSKWYRKYYYFKRGH